MRRIFLVLIIVGIIVLSVILLGLQVSRVKDSGSIGLRGHDMVHGPYGFIDVEIDYEPTAAPNHDAVNLFLDFVHRYTGKVATATYTEVPKQRVCYTIEQAEAYSESVRSSHSLLFGLLQLHALFLDNSGCSSPLLPLNSDQYNATVAAFTYDATSMVVFANVVGGSVLVEAATMSHESAHMMGLMCITYPTSDDSKCDGSGHSTDSTSLMAPILNTNSQWVQTLTLQPNEVNDLQNYV